MFSTDRGSLDIRERIGFWNPYDDLTTRWVIREWKRENGGVLGKHYKNDGIYIGSGALPFKMVDCNLTEFNFRILDSHEWLCVCVQSKSEADAGDAASTSVVKVPGGHR